MTVPCLQDLYPLCVFMHIQETLPVFMYSERTQKDRSVRKKTQKRFSMEFAGSLRTDK